MGEHYQRLIAQAEAANIPLSVSLEITGRCPLACAHCYVRHDTDELSTRPWLALVDELAGLGTMFVTLTGGEPFARDDTLEIAEHARRRGMAVTLLTSGAIGLDFDSVAALRPLSVGLSLYSADPAVHDTITRTPGSHGRALDTATELRRRNVRVRLGAPILAANADSIGGVLDVAERIGAEVILDPITIIRRDGDPRAIGLRPTPEALARALRAIGDTFEAGARAPDDPMCAAGRRVATVLPNGDVLACSLYPEPAGNITRVPFTDIWKSSPVLARLRDLTVGSLDPRCAQCEKHGFCGRCGALALLEDGALLGPSRAACTLGEARAQARASHLDDRRGRLQICDEQQR